MNDRLDPLNLRVNVVIWSAIGLIMAIDALLIVYWGMAVRIQAGEGVLLILGACTVIAFIFRVVKRDDTLFLFGNTIAQMIVMGGALGFLNHLTARFQFPLRDEVLLAIDQALHFNWLNYIGWANAHPNTALFFELAYQSYNFQGVLLICMLFIYKNAGHAQRTIIISFFSAFTCILTGAILPAMGAYHYLHIDLGSYPNLHPTEALIHMHTLEEVRKPDYRLLSFPSAGVVMFPSFHAAMAVFLTYASLPFRKLRLIIIPLNLLMLFSLPINGGHYLVDIPAGITLAVLGAYIAEKLLPRAGRA